MTYSGVLGSNLYVLDVIAGLAQVRQLPKIDYNVKGCARY